MNLLLYLRDELGVLPRKTLQSHGNLCLWGGVERPHEGLGLANTVANLDIKFLINNKMQYF